MSEKETQKETQMKTKLYWEIEVRDKSGKIIEIRQVEARSWLKQFLTILKGEFATRNGSTVGTGNVSVTDEGGTGRSYPLHESGSLISYYVQLSTLGDVGDVSQGIIVGSGDTPNDINTYKLANKIAHGSGSGQLVYNAETVEDVTNPSGSDLQFRITRTFTNNSGAVVTVKEIGLLVKKWDRSGTSHSFLVARDVLPSPVDVPDGSTLTIRYVVRITVS